MNTPPTATNSSPDAPQPSETSYFECPKCHRQCRSRTWFLKHLETCFKGPNYASANGPSSSSMFASGEASAGPSLASQQQPQPQQHYSHHRTSRGTGIDDTVLSPVFEPIGSSLPASSVYSYKEVRSRRNSRLRFGDSINNDVLPDLSDSVVSPSAGASRASALAFSFKHSYTPDTSQTCSVAKPIYGNSDDTPSRGLHAHFSDGAPMNRNNSSSNGGGEGSSSGGGNAVPRLSHRASGSQGSSSYVGSPLSLRALTGAGESASAGFSSQRPAAALPASVPAASVSSAGFSYQGTGSAEEVLPQQAPARQGSFRLNSDGTWTQYTPTTSSSSSDDGIDVELNGGDAFLAYSNRQSLQLLCRGSANDTSSAPHHHQPSRRQSNSSGHSRQRHGRDAGSQIFNAGSRHVSPAGPDTLSEASIHERNGSVSSNRNESMPGTANHPSLSLPVSPSLPRDHERLVPRLVTGGAMGGQTPPDRKGSGVDGDRFSRSQHGSTSPGTLSRMSLSASPMFAQAMASPTSGHVNVSSQSAASVGRLSGVNGSSGGSGGPSGVRTPRQNDRNGSATPRAISFQRGRAVGSGGFGTVYQAILSDGSLAAVKELKLENTNLKAIDREVRAMSSIPPHPNCVRYLGSRYSAHHYYIIMEYISGGSINSLRKSVGRFRESVFQRYAYMVLLGLAHLHAHGIVHRDIKGANVLLDESGCAKIVDFGCSRDLNQATTTLTGGGTPLWMAPEVCRGEPATEKSDVWAFGCLCLEMTNGTGLPWNFPANITLQGVVYAIACAKASPPIPADLSPEAQDFLQRCFKIDANERATVAELLQHPFFDVDLMEDSDEDELLSSCPQSTVKRMAEQVRGSRIQDTRATDRNGGENDAVNGTDGKVRGSPLAPGTGVGAQPPHTSLQQGNAGFDSNDGDLIVSKSTYSKSPSGPRLDHYPHSVNVGFSLQAVDEDDDDAENSVGSSGQPAQNQNVRAHEEVIGVAAALEEPSAFGANSDNGKDVGGPPAIAVTSVPTNRVLSSSVDNPADPCMEDEDEYAQMITEIITQAREAYTDEERRITEQRRRRNDMYPSSDEEDDSFSGSSHDTSAAQAAIHHGRQQHVQSASDITSSGNSNADDGDDSGERGPRKHSQGTTCRAARNSSSPVIPVNQTRPQCGNSEVEGVERKLGSPWNAQMSPDRQTHEAARVTKLDHEEPTEVSQRGTVALRRYATLKQKSASDGWTPVSPNAQTHADPQSLPLSSLVNPLASPSVVMRLPQQQEVQLPSTATLSPHSHQLPPHHHTQTLLASPKEATRDTPPCMSTATPPKGLGIVANETPVSSSEPGGPGRSSASSHSHVRLSPSFLPPSTTATAASTLSPALHAAASNEVNRNSTSFQGHSSPRTPQPSSQSTPTPALTVGGPSRQSSQAPVGLTNPFRHPSNGTPVEWYTGGSGQLDRNLTWQTGASADQPKEWSMAQKEMQDMLDWGRSSDCHSSTVSSSPVTLKRSAKDPSSGTAGESQGMHRHRHRRHSEEEQSQSPAAADPVKGLASTEKVEVRRRHFGLGIFRSRKSK